MSSRLFWEDKGDILHRKKQKQKNQGGSHLGDASKGKARVWVVGRRGHEKGRQVPSERPYGPYQGVRVR